VYKMDGISTYVTRFEGAQGFSPFPSLFNTLRILRKIIFEEVNNVIFINVSSGSKIQSIASMMACMIFKDRVDITPYYAAPEGIPQFRENKKQLV